MCAGVTVPSLSRATPTDLDVVLFKLPMGRVGVSIGGNAVQGRIAIMTNPYWSSEERQAVPSVMNALGSRRGTTTLLVLDFMVHCEQVLADRGIDPAFF
jgi:hypothetical protein